MNNIFKIILVIISCFLVIQHTVFANQTKEDGSGLLWFITHNEGEVCPLGVTIGKYIITPLSIILIYLLYNNKYSQYKCIHLIILLIGICLSLLNPLLCMKLIPVFIIHLFIYK